MFGHTDDQSAQDPNQISDQSIDAAMASDTPSPMAAPTVQTTVQPTTEVAPAAPDDSGPAPAASDNGAPEPVDANDLIDIKQHALTQLTPLLGHLDHSPEEKFRTTMMMIQASDDQSLIRSAFAAAQNITDEKTRAQALLDIVNEINYFTQHHDQQ